jgi:hypothetical protein
MNAVRDLAFLKKRARPDMPARRSRAGLESGAGIMDGDLVVVDRSVEAVPGPRRGRRPEPAPREAA